MRSEPKTRQKVAQTRKNERKVAIGFKHEFDSGRTSAVSQSLLGFGTDGDITNYNDVRPNLMSDVITKSSKLITFIDFDKALLNLRYPKKVPLIS